MLHSAQHPSPASIFGFLGAAWLFLGACNQRSDEASAPSHSVGHQAPPVAAAPSPVRPDAVAPSASAVAPSGSASHEPPCATICAATSRLNCGATASGCVTHCEEMRSLPNCKRELARVIDCMVHLQPADWQCGSEGLAELRDGACDAEQGAVISCLSALP